jgi:PAS domain S-box-containing protein
MSLQDPVNILLVDDQPGKLLSYEVILADLGENLIKANSAHEALEFLLKNEVAVVLVDVCMPDLDGFELARMLRDHPRYQNTAIIFVSAIHLSDLDRVRGYETGAVDYVPVPVIPEILRAKVKVFVELWRKTRQLESLNAELEWRVRERTAELEDSSKQLRAVAARLRLASEAAAFGTYEYNAAAGEAYWSPYVRRLAGIDGDGPLTLEDLLTVVHPEHRELVRTHVQGKVPEPGLRELEFKIVKPDGEVRWLLDRGQAVAEAGGPGLRVMGTVLDITDRKRNEERQKLLMAELDHRVKNILSNVSAIVRLSSSRAQTVGAFVGSLDGRIQAISRAHGLLRRRAWAFANLMELVNESLSPFRTSGNIEISGEPLSIVPELAQSMALILHELATNAVKHGSLSHASGRVKVSWLRPSAGQLRFLWQELGGPPATPPCVKGFGLTVLETAALDLGAVANCSFRQEGFAYTLQGSFELAQPQARVFTLARAQEGARKAGARQEPGILIVEDEALVALQLQSEVEEAGYRVIGPARSLKHGLMLASQDNIDAAFLDVSLGQETSAAIAEQLVARNIPFAFATGYADDVMLPQHLRAFPKLNKPYVSSDIRNMLATLIGTRKREQEGQLAMTRDRPSAS